MIRRTEGNNRDRTIALEVMNTVTENPFSIAAGTVSQGVKRVRPYLKGYLVADSAAPLLVWEHAYYPQYAFAPDEVEVDLKEVGPGPRSKVFGPSVVYDVVVDGVATSKAAVRYPEAPETLMRDRTLFVWSAMSTWLEEDEVVHFHARNPYVRVDSLQSSRHVQIRYNGEVVADSRRPVVLFETGLTPRYYLPRTDVRMDLLTERELITHCPYKGSARYWSLQVGSQTLDDVVWGYDAPFDEARNVAGLVSFWPEKSTDLEVFVDGQRLGAPA